jgi:hypothetical protein
MTLHQTNARQVLAYGVVIRDDQGNADLFDADTEWEADAAGVGLYVNHGMLVGRGTVVRGEDGLWVRGIVYGPMRRRVAGLDWMSAKIQPVECRTLPDGTTHHLRARLVEVSVTSRPCCPGTAVVHGVRAT